MCTYSVFPDPLPLTHTLSQISGREMFEFNPELVQGDDQEAGDDATLFSHHEEEEEEGEGEGGREEGRMERRGRRRRGRRVGTSPTWEAIQRRLLPLLLLLLLLILVWPLLVPKLRQLLVSSTVVYPSNSHTTR